MNRHKKGEKTLDFATGKLVKLLPEEIVRQEQERHLHYNLGYPKEVMDIRVPIQMGSSKKEADIVLYQDKTRRNILGIVETKAEGEKDGKEQLMSYMSAVACRWGMWTNGKEFVYLVKSPQTGKIEENPGFSPPRYGEESAKIRSVNDLRPAPRLQNIFRKINGILYANTNLAKTERQGAEMVRLIFCKMQDEKKHERGGVPDFQVKQDESPKDLRMRIESLWQEVKDSTLGRGVFSDSEKIEIDDRSLAMIVGELQGFSLAKTERDAVGDAFEVFAERQFAGEKGQFFTPRMVVDMAVEMMQLKNGEEILDPACGSGGFLIRSLQVMWEKYYADLPSQDKINIARQCFFGIDKEKDLVRICKAHMCIMGDGRTNIAKADTLKGHDEWEDPLSGVFFPGRYKEIRQFDVILTNPPFGTKIKVAHKHVLEKYDLGHKWKKEGESGYVKTNKTKPTPPQVLFIERCLQMLKEGGRMAIVLPDGVFGNPTDEHIRLWLLKRAEILAIVDCPKETFQPHTPTKTSVLFIRKTKAPQQGRVFMAIAEKCGHTPRGEPLYKDQKEEILDEDFTKIAENYRNGNSRGSHLGFFVPTLRSSIWVPCFYDPRLRAEIKKLQKKSGADFRTLREMCDAGEVAIRGIGRHPDVSKYSDMGTFRFIRTSDIGCYELREVTAINVDKSVFEEYAPHQDLREHDILFVKDGDARIGDNVMLGSNDLNILAQGHFYKIRPLQIDPYLFFGLLNSQIVKRQIRQFVFNQATLSTIGSRIYDLQIPIPRRAEECRSIIQTVKKTLSKRRHALIDLQEKIRIL